LTGAVPLPTRTPITNIQAQTKKMKQVQPVTALRLKTKDGFFGKDTFLFFFITGEYAFNWGG
jgi:hypothetical protein